MRWAVSYEVARFLSIEGPFRSEYAPRLSSGLMQPHVSVVAYCVSATQKVFTWLDAACVIDGDSERVHED